MKLWTGSPLAVWIARKQFRLVRNKKDFKSGFTCGYTDCALDIHLGYPADDNAELVLRTGEFATSHPKAHSADWYAGWLSGYRARRKKHESRANRG